MSRPATGNVDVMSWSDRLSAAAAKRSLASSENGDVQLSSRPTFEGFISYGDDDHAFSIAESSVALGESLRLSPYFGFINTEVELDYYLHVTLRSYIKFIWGVGMMAGAEVYFGLGPKLRGDDYYGWWHIVTFLSAALFACMVVAGIIVMKCTTPKIRGPAFIGVGVACCLCFGLLFFNHFEYEIVDAHWREENFNGTSSNSTFTEEDRRESTGLSRYYRYLIMFIVVGELPVKFFVPCVVFSFAMSYLSIPFTTDPILETTPQIVARIFFDACVWISFVVLAAVVDKSSRELFITYREVLRSTKEIRFLKEQVDAVLNVMLPEDVLFRIASGETRIFDKRDVASVSFSDVVGFTKWCSKRTGGQVCAMVNHLITAFDRATAEHDVDKVKTIGDAYWAVSGIFQDVGDRCAVQLLAFNLRQIELVEKMNSMHPEWENVKLRVGCNTGSIVGGVVGTKQISYEVFGETSDMAEHLEQHAPHNSVLVSASTKEAVERCVSDYQFKAGPLLDTFVATLGTEENLDDSLEFIDLSSVRFQEPNFRQFSNRATIMTGLGLAEHKKEFVSNANPFAPPEENRRQSLIDEDVAENLEEPNFNDGDSRFDAEHLERIADATRHYKLRCGAFFEPPELQEEFYEFDNHDRHSLRVQGTVYLALISSAFIVGICIEASNPADVWLPLLLLLFDAIAYGAIARYCHLHRLTRFQSNIHHLICWLLQLVFLVALYFLPESFLMRSMTAAFELTDHIFWVFAPADMHWILQALRRGLSGSFMIANGEAGYFVIKILGLIACVLFIRRPSDAQRFALELVVTDASNSVLKEMAIVRNIVESTAPRHVIGHMVRMMSKPFKDRGYAMNLDRVTVCFCRVSLQEENNGFKSDLSAYRNVYDLHNMIEQTLDLFPAAVKIKTVGSTLMIAGPLEPKATDDQVVAAAQDIVRFAHTVVKEHHGKDIENGLDMSCGVHCGPLQAAILGTNRLTYDIFGDTVNMASRCASTCPGGKSQMTKPTHHMVRSESLVGENTTRFMKGFGDVPVFVF